MEWAYSCQYGFGMASALRPRFLPQEVEYIDLNHSSIHMCRTTITTPHDLVEL